MCVCEKRARVECAIRKTKPGEAEKKSETRRLVLECSLPSTSLDFDDLHLKNKKKLKTTSTAPSRARACPRLA